jgi:hypothetical protein
VSDARTCASRLEACEPIGIQRERFRQNFQRNVATEFHVVGTTHADPTRADSELNLVLAEVSASESGQTHHAGNRREAFRVDALTPATRPNF